MSTLSEHNLISSNCQVVFMIFSSLVPSKFNLTFFAFGSLRNRHSKYVLEQASSSLKAAILVPSSLSTVKSERSDDNSPFFFMLPSNLKMTFYWRKICTLGRLKVLTSFQILENNFSSDNDSKYDNNLVHQSPNNPTF